MATDLTIRPYDAAVDFAAVSTLWQETLPQYPVSPQHLEYLLGLRWGSHFVALTHTPTVEAADSRLIGFCATYTNVPGQPSTNGHLPVILIQPDFQTKGYGSKLLQHSLDHLWKSFKTVNVGYAIPRFWPGVPKDLNQAFFARRGFKESTSLKDLYQPLSTFQAPQYIVDRAVSSGITFEPLAPSGYDECIGAIESKFPQWAGAYRSLHKENLDDDIMIARDQDGRQVGWGLMLSPSKSKLWSGFAFLPVVGGEDGVSGTGKTALIAAVGVSEDARGKGAGLGMMCAAMEEMKKRGGIDGVFVDTVALENFYEKVGFQTWKEYREFIIEH